MENIIYLQKLTGLKAKFAKDKNERFKLADLLRYSHLEVRSINDLESDTEKKQRRKQLEDQLAKALNLTPNNES